MKEWGTPYKVRNKNAKALADFSEPKTANNDLILAINVWGFVLCVAISLAGV